ncbi:MAG: hypothetical protein HKO62_00335 [Gammaproteobacteria bacterium]|nr:hypothetical protein [Gammaproteobacteria bacterium]
MTVVASASADEAAVGEPGGGSGRVIDYGDEDAVREAEPARPAPPATRTDSTRRVELITGGNSTDGAAKVGVLPIED